MTNPNNIVQGKHLESLASSSKRYILEEISELCTAIQNDLENCFHTSTRFTLASGAWTQNPNETSEYSYSAAITLSGVTADDYAVVDFDRATQATVLNSILCPSGETATGVINLYAKNAPTDSITGQVTLWKGAV